MIQMPHNEDETTNKMRKIKKHTQQQQQQNY